MQAVRKMGSLSKIMGMIPGMAQFKDQLENFDEREIDRIQALILSMTPAERDNPKMIDGSRRARIARGSGRSVSDVNQLVDRFFEARKMMMSMAGGGGMPGMPGMPGMGGKRAKARQQASSKRAKRGSGNPAKRAAQERAAATGSRRPIPTPAPRPSASRRATRPHRQPTSFELPKELTRPPRLQFNIAAAPDRSVTRMGSSTAGAVGSVSAASSCPTARPATSMSSTAPSRMSRSPTPTSSRPAGSSRGWSTRTATSASTRTGPCPTTSASSRRSADRDAGMLLGRDAGSPADTRWIDDREDLPKLIRAGRHIARTKRYIRNYAHEIEPDELTAYVVHEAERGDGWVKLVGDWIDRDAGDLTPCWPARGAARRDRRGTRARRPRHGTRLRR